MSVDEIAPDGALGVVAGWDSLGHMRIVLGLEARLNRTLTPDEIISLKSVADIAALLAWHDGRAASTQQASMVSA